MATRLVPPPAAQHPNMPPYVAGDAQFPKDVAVSGRSNRPLTTKARATLARPDRTLPASAKSRYKEDERSDNEIGLTEENSAWHALNSRQAVLLPETCVGLIDRTRKTRARFFGVSDRRAQGLGLVTLGPCACGGQLSFGRTFAQRVQWWVR